MNRQIIITTTTLALFGIIGVIVVSLIYSNTKTLISSNEKTAILKILNDIMPKHLYNNDLFNDTTTIKSVDDLGSKNNITVYRARKNDKPIAIIFSPIAPNGYNGKIKLLVGIHYDGSIAGVRIISHQETPGIGDKIQLNKSNWLLTFNDKSLSNPLPKQWALKPDGGSFDAFTGATITPRAVVQAIYKSLQYYEKIKDSIFEKQDQ